jgi:hypothetical protein
MKDIPKQLAPWMTPEGYFDPSKFPIETPLQQSLEEDARWFDSGVKLLRMMVTSGRAEAGIYLLGLMHYYADDLERLKMVVEALGDFRCRQTVLVLVSEFHRVESSNRTRGYLNEVLKALVHFPRELAEEPLLNLASDTKFSYRMRRKFQAAARHWRDREEFFAITRSQE